MGLAVIGRPSNLGGTTLLIELLGTVPLHRGIIVLGERDEKPNGLWPGRDGATKTADKLASGLDRQIAWALPPNDAKDLRTWLIAQNDEKGPSLGERFRQSLAATKVTPPTLDIPPPASGGVIELQDWRDELCIARIDSFGTPGVYLDRSPTGAGKSHADYEALKTWIDQL
jgi:hypothetical protein